jgi:hypothetical protein
VIVVIGKDQFASALAELQKDALGRVEGELRGLRTVTDLSVKVKSLREQVEKLEIEKGRKDEEFERKEREIEHKVGLERKRQEFELASGKREATLAVREENLKADRKRFEEQMKFHEERFTAEVGYLKEMLSDIVQRLPSAEFTADLTPVKRSRAR